MIHVKEYHRPETLSEALDLLRRPGGGTVPLAGGSWLVPRLRRDVPGSLADTVDAVVDLAALGLSYVEREDEGGVGDTLRLGAVTALATLAQDTHCQALAGGILAEAARREGPVNLRNTATVGGSLVRANPQSELVLALLALAAHVAIRDDDQRLVPLPALLADPRAVIGRGLITEVRIPWPDSPSVGGLARLARTPSDYPIVAAVALTDGHSARLSLGGVAAQPVLLRLGAAEALEDSVDAALAGVETPDDFRGSAQYRRAMAAVIARRALDEAVGRLAG